MRVKSSESLRRWRKRRSFSQRELATLVDCSQNTISLLEKGGPDGMTTLSEDLALEIARRLDVPWEELFELRESPGVRRMTAGASVTGRARSGSDAA